MNDTESVFKVIHEEHSYTARRVPHTSDSTRRKDVKSDMKDSVVFAKETEGSGNTLSAPLIHVNGISAAPKPNAKKIKTKKNTSVEVTRCICGYLHDDGFMIACDACGVWQHVDCVGLKRKSIPEAYSCDLCEPRKLDANRAKKIQRLNSIRLLSENSKSKSRNAPVSQESITSPPTPSVRCKTSKKSDDAKGSMDVIKTRITKGTNKVKPADNAFSHKTEPCSYDEYEEFTENLYKPELLQALARMNLSLHPKYSKELGYVYRCRVTLLPSNEKILVASVNIAVNEPIIEVFGTFRLFSQGGAHQNNDITASTKCVFFFRLGNIEICIDAREGGNDARFARKSLTPNSELRYCFDNKLRIFLYAIAPIEENSVIFIKQASYRNE